ncbi:TPA: hypothetical protein ACODIZ_003621 [Salmonella enterica subsp. enterica serovar Newport]
MPRSMKTGEAGIPFPSLFNDHKLISKVVPIFNHMHDTALTEKEAFSLLDLIWRYANEDSAPQAAQSLKVIVANAGSTIVQEIRRCYDQRPFILDFDGIEVEITAKMTIVEAMRAGMDATLKTVVVETEEEQPEPPTPVIEPAPVAVEEPVVHRKKIIKTKPDKPAVKATPVKPAKKVTPKIEEETEDDEDQTQFIGLQTYGVNPGEPLCRAVARVWPHRPALLVYEDKTIPITVEMSLIDAQIEAADVTGIDGNHVPESTSTISSSGYVMPEERPYVVAQFQYPIPVDDSEWNISHDRNSGADFVRTERAVWLDDYPYRISCVPFEEYMNTQTMFYVHCKERPTARMFDVYHELFRKHTHKVHIRQYDPATNNSRILTHEYCSWRPKEGIENGQGAGHVVSSVMEALGLNARWEQGARYRIRYWDTNVNAINHRYYQCKPNDDALKVLRHPKLKPVIQSRPAGI